MDKPHVTATPVKIGLVQVNGRTFSINRTVYDRNGRLAILLTDGLKVHSRLSTNVPAAELAENEFLAKTVGENAEFREPLLATGLFEDTGVRAQVGFIEFELWRLRVA